MKWIWFLIAVGMTWAIQAQDAPLSYTKKDAEVRTLWDIWEQENRSFQNVKVWRVLVVGVESRRTLDKEIQKFKNNFPGLEYDWEYDAPFYKLKVGAELKRLDVKPLFYQIKESYSSALEIRDVIEVDRYFEINNYEP